MQKRAKSKELRNQKLDQRAKIGKFGKDIYLSCLSIMETKKLLSVSKYQMALNCLLIRKDQIFDHLGFLSLKSNQPLRH